ncbi:NAD(P)H-flavin oxidoreductase [Neisseria sicca]|uniref:NAD(P)H-flavin oxidoreductase n=1 Tax=Neisseria sicca TaxID=490 RepID=A0A2I1X9G7_NEISI|nr:NAD(P)H-flavin oxidoreductase [Neisseria sicca]
MFGNHGLCGLPEEGAHGKSPKCLGRNLGDFGEFCKGLRQSLSKSCAICAQRSPT